MSVSHSTGRGPRFKDRTGIVVGRLTIAGLSEMRKIGKSWRSFWKCVCSCGKEVVLQGSNLASGNTRSCGCLREETRKFNTWKHGKTRTKIHSTWMNMIRRCHDENNPAFKDYGGRGITVCERWRNSFENFFADMGEPTTIKHTLDREDNDAGYSKSNCRWATSKQQSRNSRHNVHVEFNGEIMCISEWAEKLGMKMHTLYNRLFILGWDKTRAFTEPVVSTAPRRKVSPRN